MGKVKYFSKFAVVLLLLSVVCYFVLGTGYSSDVPRASSEYIQGVVSISGQLYGVPFEYDAPYECIDKVTKTSQFNLFISELLSLPNGNTASEIVHNINCSKSEYVVTVGENTLVIKGSNYAFPYPSEISRRIPSFCKTGKPGEFYSGNLEKFYSGIEICQQSNLDTYTLDTIEEGWLYDKNYMNSFSVAKSDSFPYFSVQLNHAGEWKYFDLSTTSHESIIGSFEGEEILSIDKFTYAPEVSSHKKITNLEIKDNTYDAVLDQEPLYSFTLKGANCSLCWTDKENPFCGQYGELFNEIRFSDKFSDDKSSVHFTVQNHTYEDILGKNVKKPSRIAYSLGYINKHFNFDQAAEYIKPKYTRITAILSAPIFTDNQIKFQMDAGINAYTSKDYPNESERFPLQENSVILDFSDTSKYLAMKELVKSCSNIEIKSRTINGLY